MSEHRPQTLMDNRVQSFLDPRLPDRFWSKCIPEPNSGCWLWFGANNGVGYGHVWSGKKRRYAHRLAYETLIEKIPTGLDLDHLCRVRCCCNPAHLQPVSRKENARRGECGLVSGEQQRAKTHCKHGHPFTDENTYRVGGRRQCRACKRLGARRDRLRRRST
jgi:hypothetical protein